MNELRNNCRKRDNVINSGKAVWLQLLIEEGFSGRDVGFVLWDEECLPYWDNYLKEYIFENKPNRIFLLADLQAKETIEQIKNKSVRVLYFEKEQLKNFSSFYAVFTNGRNIFFLALDLPFGRNCSTVLGLKGLTLDKMVYYGMMSLGKNENDKGNEMTEEIKVFERSQQAEMARIMHQSSVMRLKQKLAEGKKLNVYFLAVSDGKFVCDTVYEEMLNSKNFIPRCLLIHKKDMDFDKYPFYKDELKRERTFLENCGYDVVVPYDDEWRPLPLEQYDIDILFLFASYLNIEPSYYKDKVISPNFLTCFVNYAMRNVNLDNWMYNNDIVNCSWLNFVESDEVWREFRRKSYFGTKNLIVSGYPKLDNYMRKRTRVKLPLDKFEKVVVYAPHWSMHNKGWLNLSTFHFYFQYFEKLVDEHPDILFVFKPHPDIGLHLRKLQNKGISVELTEDEYNEYVRHWNQKENGLVYLGSEYIDLFKQSDCLITDCGSFTSEWLPSGKPCLYLINPENDDPYEIYNPLGKRILESYYQCHNKEEIDRCFKDVVLCGNDSKKEERDKIIKKDFVNIGTAGRYIVSIVKKMLDIDDE